MATFISVPLKKSSEVDLVKPLSKFVTASYPAVEEQGEYLSAVEELNKLRRNALGRPLDKHESSLEILLRYDHLPPPHIMTSSVIMSLRSGSATCDGELARCHCRTLSLARGC